MVVGWLECLRRLRFIVCELCAILYGFKETTDDLRSKLKVEKQIEMLLCTVSSLSHSVCVVYAIAATKRVRIQMKKNALSLYDDAYKRFAKEYTKEKMK